MPTMTFLRYVLLALLCVPLASYAADRRAKPNAESREYSDAAVQARIKAELRKEDQANAANIHVRSVKGRVRLSGIVPTQEEAERAEGIAKAAKGVVTVRNDIQVGGTIIGNVGATR
jgi:osmotically-inducible protein OsmY